MTTALMKNIVTHNHDKIIYIRLRSNLLNQNIFISISVYMNIYLVTI